MPIGGIIKTNDHARLAVIIINYRTANLVTQCLDSLLDQVADVGGQIVVVDNASYDDSVATIENWICQRNAAGTVQVLKSNINGGFSAGNNIGINSIEAEYYLLLNSDTIVRPQAIAILLQTADKCPSAGIISPRLEWPDGTPQESCFRYLSPVSEFIDAAQTGPITTLLSSFNVPLSATNRLVSPQWTSFACVLVRRNVFAEIGVLDEGFFMYFEDVEFCRRARKAGWNIIHNPKARVVHLRGSGSPDELKASQRKRLPRYYYASRARYFSMAYGWIGLTAANLLWSLGRIVSKSRETLGRRASGVPDKQWRDIWTSWAGPGVPWHKSD